MNANSTPWPALTYQDWRETCSTLHLWLQIVGKIRLARVPWINHSWHITFQVTANGLTSRLIPFGSTAVQMDFNFVEHALRIRVVDGRDISLPLEPQSTATFYRKVMEAMRTLGVPVTITTLPCELPDPIPFDQDETHCAYDSEYVTRYWRVLLRTQQIFERFRAGFIGKCSPVHFFWGSADLAVTRFSGRTAPQHPGGIPHLPDWVAREAYSHEVSSAGFWAGSDQYPHAAFYSYAYPQPPGFAQAEVRPGAAHFSNTLQEFVLPYAELGKSAAPDEVLMEFLQSTYEAAATLGDWERSALERTFTQRIAR